MGIQAKMAMFDDLQAQIEQLKQQQQHMAGTAHIMQNMVNDGVVEQTGRDSIVVHSANGDKEYKVDQNQ